MNFINQFFNKSKIKMENSKMTILLAMYAHFSIVKDDVRLAATAEAINKESIPLIGNIASKGNDKPVETSKKDEKPAESKKPEALKVNLVDKNTPGAPKTEPGAEKETEKEEGVDETLIEILPFHVCFVNNGKHEKKINIGAPRKFKVFTTEEAKVAANNAYPTEEEFDLVMDEAWDMATAGKTNKEIVVMLRENIGDYYPELKADSDWYGKLVNPMVASLQLIRTSFGYKGTDTTVQVTRPYDAGLKLTRDNDLVVVKAPKPEKEEVKEESKPLKTVQEGKAANRPGTDEEEQEKEGTAPEEETAKEEVTEPAGKPAPEDEKDTNKPPKVNKFDDFNALETLIFEKYREGATLSAGIKDENGRKAVLAEKRDESRMLIASAFEDETWTEKVDGKWNPLLLSYHNDIVAQISANRAKWPK